MNDNKIKYVASVSFGKDSLAMLLKLLEHNDKLDEVVFYDTGMEFKCIYKIIEKIAPMLKEKEIGFTILRSKNNFEYMMLEKPIHKRNGTIQKGYSWCGGSCRWGTTFKVREIDRYLKAKYIDKGNSVVLYVGIALNEVKRIIKIENSKQKYGIYRALPLVKYSMREKDCLIYCRQKGFHWEEGIVDLYDILDRVSCWCCSNKNTKELRNYYTYLSNYFKELERLQSQTNRPFHENKSIFDYKEQFEKEKEKEFIKTKLWEENK